VKDELVEADDYSREDGVYNDRRPDAVNDRSLSQQTGPFSMSDPRKGCKRTALTLPNNKEITLSLNICNKHVRDADFVLEIGKSGQLPCASSLMNIFDFSGSDKPMLASH
jgi:hypothetical protein